MTAQYNDLSALAAAAAAQDCSVHMHLNEHGKPVFSVGNSDTGAREFNCYFDALASVTKTRYAAQDCIEQLAGAKALDMLTQVLAADDQAERLGILHEALVELGRLPYPGAACGGFAVALVNIVELGLKAAHENRR